ncbi:MAG: hypothetical protein KDC33_04455 [Thermoleophilia bacterium]|nr:hypothetical protein [Thermoleophilia bacterium]
MPPADALKLVYGISGEDRPKVERALGRLVARVAAEGAGDADRFDAGETPVADVIAACQTLSFGGARAVVLEGADDLKAADGDALVGYLEDPNPQTVLVLVSLGALPQRLANAVSKVGQALHWGPPAKAKPRERRAWLEDYVGHEVQRQGGTLGRGMARRITERAVVDAGDAAALSAAAVALSQEAAKLVAYARGETIGKDAVDAMVPAHPGARVYELSDAVSAGDGARAFEVLHDLSHGGDRVAPQVVQAGLMRHFQAISVVQELPATADGDDVAAATGLRGYPAQKAAEQARQLPEGFGRRAFVRVARLELDLRVGSEARLGRTPDDGLRFALERAVRDVLALRRARTPV